VSGVIMPRPPALATADASSAEPTWCMPPWMVGCSIPKSSVVLVFMLYLLNEVKRTHSVALDGNERRRGDEGWANPELTGYSAGLSGGWHRPPGGRPGQCFQRLSLRSVFQRFTAALNIPSRAFHGVTASHEEHHHSKQDRFHRETHNELQCQLSTNHAMWRVGTAV